MKFKKVEILLVFERVTIARCSSSIIPFIQKKKYCFGKKKNLKFIIRLEKINGPLSDNENTPIVCILLLYGLILYKIGNIVLL